MSKKSATLLILFYTLIPLTFLYFNYEKISTWGGSLYKFTLFPAFLFYLYELIVKDKNRDSIGYSIRKISGHYSISHLMHQIVVAAGVFYFSDKSHFTALILLLILHLSLAHFITSKELFQDVRRDYFGMFDELRSIKGLLTWEEACEESSSGMASLEVYLRNSDSGPDLGDIKATINTHGTVHFQKRPPNEEINDKNLSNILKEVAKWKPINPKEKL